MIEYDDPICAANGAKAVADDQRRLVLVVVEDIVKDIVFGFGVDGRGGFVQDDHISIAVKSAG